MIVSVASGKGGTGKTTVAVSLALSIENSQIIDCDVEEPNVSLFLNPEIEEKIEVKTLIPEVDKNKCNYCGFCSQICAYNALSVIKLDSHGDVLLFPHLCHGCGGCILLCPENAMKTGYRTVGEITRGYKENIEFIEGRINISEVLAPKVIEEAKKLIKPDKIAIIDAPPGTSCPAVAAIKGSNFCLLVTEPTPFGLHDLELAYEVTKAVKVRVAVIINKSENDKIIEDFCEKNKIPILMKIPFQRKIAELYSKGVPLVSGMPEYKEKFQSLINFIKGTEK
jgi:MinD superfamily P-loop ATPase